MEASRSSSTEALAAARRRALCDRPVLPLTTGSLMLILMPMADGAPIQPSLDRGSSLVNSQRLVPVSQDLNADQVETCGHSATICLEQDCEM